MNECIYTLEANVNPMIAEEMIVRTCEKVEYVRTLLGENYKSRDNWKVRELLKRVLESTRVERIQIKPTVLRIVRKKSSTSTTSDNDNEKEKTTEDTYSYTSHTSHTSHSRRICRRIATAAPTTRTRKLD